MTATPSAHSDRGVLRLCDPCTEFRWCEVRHAPPARNHRRDGHPAPKAAVRRPPPGRGPTRSYDDEEDRVPVSGPSDCGLQGRRFESPSAVPPRITGTDWSWPAVLGPNAGDQGKEPARDRTRPNRSTNSASSSRPRNSSPSTGARPPMRCSNGNTTARTQGAMPACPPSPVNAMKAGAPRTMATTTVANPAATRIARRSRGCRPRSRSIASTSWSSTKSTARQQHVGRRRAGGGFRPQRGVPRLRHAAVHRHDFDGAPLARHPSPVARFEHEVTHGRVRDEIVASKATDMWMGATTGLRRRRVRAARQRARGGPGAPHRPPLCRARVGGAAVARAGRRGPYHRGPADPGRSVGARAARSTRSSALRCCAIASNGGDPQPSRVAPRPARGHRSAGAARGGPPFRRTGQVGLLRARRRAFGSARRAAPRSRRAAHAARLRREMEPAPVSLRRASSVEGGCEGRARTECTPRRAPARRRDRGGAAHPDPRGAVGSRSADLHPAGLPAHFCRRRAGRSPDGRGRAGAPPRGCNDFGPCSRASPARRSLGCSRTPTASFGERAAGSARASG